MKRKISTEMRKSSLNGFVLLKKEKMIKGMVDKQAYALKPGDPRKYPQRIAPVNGTRILKKGISVKTFTSWN
jgi:hypothetical protein